MYRPPCVHHNALLCCLGFILVEWDRFLNLTK
jgi:hypothetical protein